MLQLLKNLRFSSEGKELTDVDILNWANSKVKKSGRQSQMESFKVRNRTLAWSVCLHFILYHWAHEI